MASGVVGNQIVGDAPLAQFPAGEQCPLQARPRLIHQHMDLFALLVRGKNHAQGGAPIHGGQCARVAMVQNGVAVANQFRAVVGHPVDFHVVVGDFLGERRAWRRDVSAVSSPPSATTSSCCWMAHAKLTAVGRAALRCRPLVAWHERRGRGRPCRSAERPRPCQTPRPRQWRAHPAPPYR
jgi:hypothetical protein